MGMFVHHGMPQAPCTINSLWTVVHQAPAWPAQGLKGCCRQPASHPSQPPGGMEAGHHGACVAGWD
jgi:hypothetical protein